MRVSRAATAAALLGFLAPAPGLPQAPRFPGGTALVVLSATALDKQGRPVTDLRRDEFRVLEDGRPQKLEHFSEGRESAARVLFLVDASGSMSGQLKTTSTRMALKQLLAALGPEDEAALAAFDHKYWGVVAFTRDREAIEQAYSDIEPFSSTALHDALGHAASDLASHGEGRRAVVVITDGVDTASSAKAEDVIARSQALDVPIYAVTVLSPIDDPRSKRFVGKENSSAGTAGAQVLDRYSRLSGGAAFVVSDFGALQQAARTIVSELKHQYRLGYDPPPGPRRFRHIQVVTTRKGVVVKTRGGYMPSS
jgi:Ca-activated chloride channel family protein